MMQVMTFNVHSVTECECCGILLSCDARSDELHGMYMQHLKNNNKCREWHDKLPTLDEVRGILRTPPEDK